MLKPLLSRRPAETATRGWVVEALIPIIGVRQPMQRLFAVAADDKQTAEKLVWQQLGNLHCTICARVGLTGRALANFRVAEGEVTEIDTD
jgi:hypothetical protein